MKIPCSTFEVIIRIKKNIAPSTGILSDNKGTANAFFGNSCGYEGGDIAEKLHNRR